MFKFFRRYQKILIVVGGVILMLAFTVAEPLSNWVQSRNEELGRQNPNATAVTWKGGRLTEGELSRLMYNRQMANAFVQYVDGIGAQSAELAGIPDFGARVQPVGLIGENWTEEMLEEEVLRQHILAERARKLGIVVSDQTVSDYIEELGRGELDGDQLRGILQMIAGSNRPLTADEIYNIIRNLLLADAALQAYGAGPTTQDMLAAELPVNRWEEWKRTNDRIVIEAAAIDPATSLLDVAEPTDAELRKYFDEHKEQFGFPVTVLGVELPSSEPGFHIPRKITLKYLRANFDEYVERYSKEITDEEIAAYYEERKNPMFIAAELESTEVDVEETPASETPAEETPAGETPAEESSETPAESTESTEPAAETAEPMSEEPATEGEAAEQPAEGAGEPADEPASDAAPAEGEPAPEGAAEENPAPENAAIKSDSPFRLAAYQQSEEDAPAETPAADDTSETPTSETPATETEPAESEASAATETDVAVTEETEDEIKFQPLEEVKDDIRRRLAEDKFFDNIDAVMQGAVARLNPFYSTYLSQKLDAEAAKKPVPAPPAELVDFAPIAKELNLELEETGELDIVQLRDSNIGKTVGDQKYRGTPLWRMMFGGDIDTFEPVITLDIGRFGDRYLVMKTSDEPARIPTFEEAREQVLAAWKREQAAKLALEKAKSTAKTIQESGLDLTAYYVDQPEMTVTKTAPFTQFTEGDIAPTSRVPSYRLSQPQGLKAIGPQFMEDVFKLKQGEVTALPNYDNSTIYVVRLADEYESNEQLRTDFLEQANFWPGRFAFLGNNAQNARQMALNALFEDSDIEWKRPDESETNDADADAEESES
jgi:chemotaxis protein histidine kinase CheA